MKPFFMAVSTRSIRKEKWLSLTPTSHGNSNIWADKQLILFKAELLIKVTYSRQGHIDTLGHTDILFYRAAQSKRNQNINILQIPDRRKLPFSFC